MKVVFHTTKDKYWKAEWEFLVQDVKQSTLKILKIQLSQCVVLLHMKLIYCNHHL